MVSFAQPPFLLLLVLIPISVIIAWPRLWQKRRLAASDGRQGRGLSSVSAPRLQPRTLASLLVRCGLITSVVLALAGLQSVQRTNKMAVVFLIDASDSIGPAGVETATRFVRDALHMMRPDGSDQAAVVVFGADAQIERGMSSVRDLAQIGTQVRSAGTNIEGAIRLGLSLLPTDSAKRLILLSDGKQTVGDADSAARLVQATNARLDAVALPSVQGPDAAIERIDAPQRASVGQVIPLQIVVRSNQAMPAQLTVFAGPDVVAQESVNLVTGQNEFSVRASATRAGFSAFRVQLTAAQDVQPQNNTLSASVIVGGPPRVLLVSVPPSPSATTPGVDETSALKAALKAAGIVFDEVSPRAMPSEIQSLASYQSILLVNVPARELSLRAMYSIQSYVRDIGGGLVAIGGPNSFGVGGYFKTPLEETLPVDMQVKDPKRFPSVSIVVVMDKSGSMSAQENGVMKLRLASEAAARVAEQANDDDEVTVIAFDTDPVDFIGPFPGRDRQKYLSRILSIAPGGGGIYIYESLQVAQKVVSKSTKQSKFIILLADGNDSEHQEGARELVRKMQADNNTTLTAVAIGDGSDVGFLKNIAAIGKGRFHLTDKAATLPTIFTEETALAQRSYIVEQEFFPKQGATSPILSGITTVPALQGYIASTAKPAAQVILKANASDPLLASWQYGLGRAVAFTSDATGRWAKNWVQWTDFPKFWAQTVRWTILERGQSTIQASIQQHGDQTVISADVPEGRVADDLRLNATVIDADGKTRDVTLSQTAPGRYEAETYLDQAGAYFVRVKPVISATQTAAQTPVLSSTLNEATVAYVRPYSPEYAPTTGGEGSLRDWSTLGGGALLTSPASTFVLNAPVATSRTDLFPWLLALAALLLPFDVGLRRITISLRKLFAPSPSIAPVSAGNANAGGRVTPLTPLSQLMQAKSRTTSSVPGASTPTSRAGASPQPTRQTGPSATAGAPRLDQPGPTIPAPTSSVQQAAATASALLRRKRQQQTQGDTPTGQDGQDTADASDTKARNDNNQG